jgi:hypothetical protein
MTAWEEFRERAAGFRRPCWPGRGSRPSRTASAASSTGSEPAFLLDVAFPKTVRDELVSAGLAQPHHLLPQSGWVSFYLREEGDVERAVSLLARSYELAREQQARKHGAV